MNAKRDNINENAARDIINDIRTNGFADFPVDTIPPILLGDAWEGHTFRNDMCPSVANRTLGLQVFIDFPDPAQREFESIERFVVWPAEWDANGDRTCGDDEDPIFCTESAEELNAWILERKSRRGDTMNAEMLARAFIRELRTELTQAQIDAIVATNAERNDRSCATHDYVDANQTMLDAYEKATGESMQLDCEDPRWDAVARMMDDAHTIAKAALFDEKRIAHWQISDEDLDVLVLHAVASECGERRHHLEHAMCDAIDESEMNFTMCNPLIDAVREAIVRAINDGTIIRGHFRKSTQYFILA